MTLRYASALAMFFLVLLVPASAIAAHYYVYEDGSGDFATIGLACSTAVSGDTILIGCGTYDEPRIDLIPGRNLVIRSVSGESDCTTLMFQFSIDEGHRYPQTVITIEDVTFQNGGGIRSDGEFNDYEEECYSPVVTVNDCVFDDGLVVLYDCGMGRFHRCEFVNGSHVGNTGGLGYFYHSTFEGNHNSYDGGVFDCWWYAVLETEDCVFRNNSADDDGGVLHAIYESWVEFARCRFENNSAGGDGGAISSYYSYVRIHDCLFAGNIATLDGGAVALHSDYSSRIDSSTLWGNSAGGSGGGVFGNLRSIRNTIIAGSTSGSAMAGALPRIIQCTDLWGNEGGDWVGPIADSLYVNDNFSANPKFCNPSIGDFGLLLSSPCFDSPACGQVGAYGEGCVSPWTDIPETEIGPLAAGLAIRPNPFSGETTIRFAPGAAAAARLSIYDIRGREVLNTELDGSRGVATWDGNDPSGKPVAPGVYFIRLETDRDVENGKVSLIR